MSVKRERLAGRHTRSDSAKRHSVVRRLTKPWWRRPASRVDYSRYFQQAITLPQGTRIVICARVSNREGKSTADRIRRVEAQAEYLRREAERLGLVVVDIVTEVGPGTDPCWIARAVGVARRAKAECLLFHTVSRAVRHEKYHSELHPELQATENELWYMTQFSFGFPLTTLVDPNADSEVEHKAHVKAGLRMTTKKLGRPRKPESKSARRRRLQKAVQQMHADGRTLGDISRDLKVPRSTVQDWVRGCTDSQGENH